MNEILFFMNNFVIFLLTWISIYIALPFFRKYFPDRPNKRSSHIKIKPSGVGIIIAFFSSIGFYLNGQINFTIIFFLSFLGLIDDKFKISARLRFLCQFLFVNFLISNSQIYNNFFLNHSLLISLVFWFISNLILIGIINFINFMDGIDGLVGSCMIFIILSCSFFLGLNFTFIISSILAFLLWNWSPSKVFMGDSGSTFFGGFIVISILNTYSFEDSSLIFFSCSPLLIDSFICLLRRLLNGQKIFEAHKLHLYQRLNQNGWSHSNVASLYLISTMIFFLTCISRNWLLVGLSLIILLSYGFYLDRNHAIPFKSLIK